VAIFLWRQILLAASARGIVQILKVHTCGAHTLLHSNE